MSARHLAVQDYFNLLNGLLRFQTPVSVAASCQFDIRWSGPVTSRGPVTGPSGSSGQLVMSEAMMTWSAHSRDGFRFVSDPSGTTSFFAQLGHVRNGVFNH